MTDKLHIISVFTWNDSREKAAIALSEGRTQKESAERAGVTDRTIREWLSHPDFASEVDRLSLMVGVALRAERLRIVHRVIRQMIKDDGNVPTEKDILDWLKYAQSETNGVKLDLAALAENAASLADSGSGSSKSKEVNKSKW